VTETPVQSIDVTANLGIDPWRDLTGRPMLFAEITRVGMLPARTADGPLTVILYAEPLDGSAPVVMQTSWYLFRKVFAAVAVLPVVQLDGELPAG
jgi:hypothetical protein